METPVTQTEKLSAELEGKVAFKIAPGVVQYPGGKIDLRTCSMAQIEKVKKYLKPFVKEVASAAETAPVAETPAPAPTPSIGGKEKKSPEEK